MRTDAALIARLALEIAGRFGGARVRDAGQLGDGRFALALWRKGRTQLLCADVFAPTPLITIEDGELPIAAEPGFVRAAGAALRGKSLTAARSIAGERILELQFASQSRFGVPESYDLIYELVPRFGNVIVAKGGIVVAALKEFRRSGKAARSVRPGIAYEPPPARVGKAATHFAEEPSAEAIRENDLYVYRDAAGSLLQAHVVPLTGLDGAACERAPSLIELMPELRATHPTPSEPGAGEDKARTGAQRLLEDRARKLSAELARVEAALAVSAERDDLRARGDAIYGGLHELAPAERQAAKDEAAAVFARYKKAGTAAAHLARRRAAVRNNLDEVEELRWELERAGHDQVREILELVKPRGAAPGPKSRPRKRAPMQGVTPGGTRVYAGRSPAENAELTFRTARPNDLWFHARGQPGAHVILQRDDRAAPGEDDIRIAAELAALHSKGGNGAKVTVDYTQRKHVRKRPGAAPGLVFYTEAASLVVEPRDSINIASPKEKKR
ncbi:MAG TPA: NFACT RNA binding domain-containing protein [Candidatus Rubrimentiphilum sp.]|nr:NFACT RNA binding domain-containing protein [Candidatus Rubrimentiphilum sp.]